MRKLATILLAAAAVALLAAPAMAANFWTETFPYANGNLTSVTANWTTHSGTVSGTNDIQVINGIGEGNESNAPDDNRTFAAVDSTVATYYCMNVTIPQPATTPVVNNYFAHLKDTGTFNFMARLFVLPVAGAAGNFTFGISVFSVSTAVPPVAWPGSLSFGTTYNVVVKYDANGKTATLWVNPSSELSSNVVSNTSSAGAIPKVSVSAFALRQSSSGSPATGTVNWKYDLDNIGVGSSFADACLNTLTKVRAATWGELRRLYQ